MDAQQTAAEYYAGSKDIREAKPGYHFTGISELHGEMAQWQQAPDEMEDGRRCDEDGWEDWDEVGILEDSEEKTMAKTTNNLVPDAGSPRPDPGEIEATQAVAEIQKSKTIIIAATPEEDAKREMALTMQESPDEPTPTASDPGEAIEDVQQRQTMQNFVDGKVLVDTTPQAPSLPAEMLPGGSSTPQTYQTPAKVQIWRSSENTDQIKMLIYGASGVGKTVFASTAPEVLFLDADDGMMSVKNPVSRWKITDWSDLKEAHRFLRGVHQFKTVVLDSLNAIQWIGMASTVASYPMKRTYDSLPNISDWGKSLDDFAKLIRAFRALPMRVIFVCATKNRDFEDERAEPQLSGKQTVNMLCQNMDVIAYLSVEDREAGRKPIRVMAFDIGNSITKDRTNKLPPILMDPTWAKVQAFWK